MGVREQLNTKKTFGVAAGIALVVVGLGAIAYQASTGSVSIGSREPEAHFTTDDGKTWFTAPSSKLAPFDHNGKPAVRARVFNCDGKPFVAYLERFTPAGLKAQSNLNAAKTAKAGPGGTPNFNPADIMAASTGKEVKRPSDKSWSPAIGAAGGQITSVKCPDGKSTPEPLLE